MENTFPFSIKTTFKRWYQLTSETENTFPSWFSIKNYFNLFKEVISTYITTNSKLVHNVFAAGAGVVVVLSAEAASYFDKLRFYQTFKPLPLGHMTSVCIITYISCWYQMWIKYMNEWMSTAMTPKYFFMIDLSFR